MLEFQKLTANEGARLRPYYEACNYRLCEYSLGVKLMWRGYLHPWFAEAAGCLIIRNCIEGEYVFDYPILGPDGNEDAALTAIEQYCAEKELPLVLSVVPEDKAAQLVLRYPRVSVSSERPWKDYLYHTEDLAQFAGRRYSGQRNHINKFRRDYPDAEFVPLSDPQDPRLAAFWSDYEAEFHKTGPLANDARDKGLRTSKLQYLPAALGGKVRLQVGTELDVLRRIPTLKTDRLTLTPLRPSDCEAYNALCLDDDRNRWWGYDYRAALNGAPLTEDYFLSVAKADFTARRAVNFAVRLKGKLIGEVVLYRPDFRGGFEQGCRIAPAYAGHGYGTEAFAAAADWALYHLGLARVVAKCFKENAPSHRMLSACMRPSGEDAAYFYFEKTV